MTDAAAYGNGYMPSSVSAPRANPGLDESAGPAEAERFRTSAAADSGTAAARANWPGVARPAGWFLPVPGEAAPPDGPGTEPARTETTEADEDRPDPAGDATEPAGDATEPAVEAGVDQVRYEPDDYWYPGSLPASWQVPDAGLWQSAQPGRSPEPPTRVEPTGPAAPVVGPTAALRGRAGGPGLAAEPDGTPAADSDSGSRSGWQLAHGVWRGSGIRWEEPAAPAPEPGAAATQGHAQRTTTGGQPFDPGQAFAAAPTYADSPPFADSRVSPEPSARPAPPAYSDSPTRVDGLAVNGSSAYAGAPTFADVPNAYAGHAYPASPVYPDPSVPERQPSFAGDGAFYVRDVPHATRPEAVVTGTPMRTEEADERYRAWHDSVRAASAPRARPVRRRRVAWQLARVGVPAAVIVTVGAGAVMMLTGKSSEMLGDRANQNPPATGKTSVSGGSNGAGNPRADGFGGYPGQRGPVTVRSFASAGGKQLAVGSADGHAAIWRRGAGGTWSLVSAGQTTVFQVRGMADLAGVAVGRAGWIAVGEAGVGHPVLLTSPDGTTWHALTGTNAFTAPGLTVAAVAADRGGYVVVGQQVSGTRKFAAMWWSPDLRHWARADNGHLIGTQPSTVNAVTTTAAGFVAVGTHNGDPAVWTTQAGMSWVPLNLPSPAGTHDGALRFAAASDGIVVAAGGADTRHGTLPFAVTSSDGGRNWRTVLLPAADGGKVTALTASGNGFVAAGQAGPASGQRTVTWTSHDGVTWSAPAPANGGPVITALARSGNATLAAGQQDSGSSSLILPAP